MTQHFHGGRRSDICAGEDVPVAGDVAVAVGAKAELHVLFLLLAARYVRKVDLLHIVIAEAVSSRLWRPWTSGRPR